MKKVLTATALATLVLPGFAAEPAGKVLAGEGKVFANSHGKVVRKALKKGEKIDRHNHEGEDIIFNVMQGAIKITLNGSEVHELKAGDTLVFNGKNFIAGEATDDTLVVITLVQE